MEVLELNPENGSEDQIDMIVEIVEKDCIGCTKCIQACPVDAIVGAAKQMHTRSLQMPVPVVICAFLYVLLIALFRFQCQNYLNIFHDLKTQTFCNDCGITTMVGQTQTLYQFHGGVVLEHHKSDSLTMKYGLSELPLAKNYIFLWKLAKEITPHQL